ncbi:MAG: autotransporter outer membrane beta-barrel domain-containing protein, partial [Hyphomicrobium sp.]|nr:autotransporter outer membrane beta-barrel domain-containing protein [Hyphomicrobium sp.]
LGYDTNNVYLTLKPGGFAAGAQSANQRAVGGVLDQSVAGSTGDFATVIGTLATFGLVQGQAAMDALSGQNYAGFATAGIGNSLLFMNTVSQQMSQARGGSGGGSRTALAQACDIACDGPGDGGQPSPFSVWGSALGGTGSIAGYGNASTLTYNAGGTATGIDYRFDPHLLLGVGLGFASGSQYLSGFSGRGTTNSYQGTLYASFTPSAFYFDALAGYAYNDNQMTRQILIPGLQRTAQGRTGANQFLGQVEAGYKIDIHERAAASLTPFARFQATTVTQAAFSETGAGSLNLNVAQQTTNSARTVLGAELAGTIDAGWRERLALQFRLGWAHEYADTSRPVTASFAGAPGAAFTVFGAAPLRDAVVVGLAANTAIAAATSLYFRYDGEVGTGSDSHAFTGGLRMSW